MFVQSFRSKFFAVILVSLKNLIYICNALVINIIQIIIFLVMEHVENQLFSFIVAVNGIDKLRRKLVDRRLSLGISQKDLALRLGIDAANMCRYETGKTMPSVLMFSDWCHALDMTLDVCPVKVVRFE